MRVGWRDRLLFIIKVFWCVMEAPSAGTRWIDGTADMARAGIKLAGQVANY